MSSKLSIAGDRIAHPTADGRVAIWDVANAKLQSEFVPPGHLGATTRVVEWIAENIIAYGTSAGRVHFLDADRNVRIGQELAGHSGDVLALVVHPIDSSLFSGSRDGHVVRWKVDKDSWSGIVDKKWKADKRPVSALSISGHGRYLISGSSQSIKLWSFPDFALVRTLNGHVSAITSLIAFDLSPPRPPTASASKKKRKSMNKHPYLVSSADGDRSVCVWNIRDVEDTESTTLSCSADVVQISVSVDANGFALIAAVTAKGTLHLFRSKFVEHRTDKPLEPTKTIRFVAPGRNGERNTIPVLHAHVFTGSRVMVVRDDWAKPAIESLEFDTLSDNNVLEREKSKIKSKSVAPEMATTVRTPVPNPQTAYTTGTVSAQKRGREIRNVVEKSLGERLDAMDKAKAKVPPDSGQSQKHLLIQGLESKDKAILDQVLNLENPATIKGTVRRLPVAYVHSLLDELTRRLSGRLSPQIALVHIRWVHSVLNEHTAYLASSPQADNLLRPLIAIREEGESLLRRMSELKGRFDMMMNKLNSAPEDFRDDDRDTQVFRDDSDEELGFGVPTSADDDELWETASEPAAAEDEEDEDEEDEASDESEMEVDSDEDG